MSGILSHGYGNPGNGEGEAIIHFPAGAKLFDLDRPSRRVYLLRTGCVQLASGHEAILDQLTPGNFFGEECLLAPRHGCQVARTLSPVTVSAFGAAQLLDRVQQDRRFARRLLKNLAIQLDRRRATICDFVTEPAERRLALLLSRLVPGRPISGWVRLRFSPSNSELARTIGATRSAVTPVPEYPWRPPRIWNASNSYIRHMLIPF
jgi:CRP/FNR family cyclic AMP-dependent transcriptional regulator